MSELLTRKLEILERQHERERAGIRYICQLVVDNEVELRGVFLPDTSDLPEEKKCEYLYEWPEEEKIPEYLYERTEKALQWVSHEALRTSGVTYSHMTRDQVRLSTEPLILLNWAHYLPLLSRQDDTAENKPIPYMMFPTQTGIDLVDGLRKAQGYVSLAEQKRINKEKYD